MKQAAFKERVIEVVSKIPKEEGCLNTILDQSFFNRPVQKVAEELIGNFIVNEKGNRLLITEVEAYDGPEDLACHASKGRTPRTEVMFGPAGYFYVYLCYGMHWMLNVVTGPEDYPAAILIRGTKEISGPARLTKKLNIDSRLNKKMAHPASGLWFEDSGIKINPKKIQKTPRIGVDYAGPVWSKKKYRFVLTRQT